MAQKLMSEARNFSFIVAGKPGMPDVVWDTVMVGGALLVTVPHNVKPEGSRESFMMLLEYAEEVLKCSRVVACFKKNRADRNTLIRVLMHFSFNLISPVANGNHGDMLYMSCSLEDSVDQSDED